MILRRTHRLAAYSASSGTASRALPPFAVAGKSSFAGVLPAKSHRTFSAAPRIEDMRPARMTACALLVIAIAVGSGTLGATITQSVVDRYDLIAAHAAATAAQRNTSTPRSEWEAGATPLIYQADIQWASRPYGEGTIATDGAAAACLTMASAKLAGKNAMGFVDTATWAQANGYDGGALLVTGAEELGLAVFPVEATEMSLRTEINRGRPVVCATAPGTFDTKTSYVTIAGIDENGKLIVHDPASERNSMKRWSFDYIIDASTALWSYRQK